LLMPAKTYAVRRALKNSRSRAEASVANTPPSALILWLRRPSPPILYTLSIAPVLGSVAP